MKKICAGILIAVAVITVGLVSMNVFGETERNKYPYTGVSVTKTDTSLMDDQTMQDIELEYLVSSKDIALEGSFMGRAELTEVAIWPEEGTNEYLVTESLAKEFGKTFEEMVLKDEYYKLDFVPASTMYSTMGRNVSENISVYIPKDTWEMFPDPNRYQHAVLFADEFPYGGENAVVTSTIGYYYVSEEGKVYSAEKFEGLDIYSGETIEKLQEEVELSRERISE